MLRRCAAAALVVGASALGAAAPATAAGTTGSVYGVTTDGRLVLFDRSDPSAPFSKNTLITGLAGADIVGLDVRPATGQLYAVTRRSSDGLGQVYAVDGNPASATFAAATLVSTLPVAMNDAQYDIDFNPIADALRIVGRNGQNLRVTNTAPATACGSGAAAQPNTNPPGFESDLAYTCVDGTLAYASGDPHAGSAPKVSGTAYTGGAGAASTKQYDIDDALDVLSIQSSNSGVLSSVGTSLGRDVKSLLGFDIATDDGTAYVGALVETPDGVGKTRWLSVDLANGTSQDLGQIGSEVLESIALAPAASDPAPVVPETPGAVALPALGAATMGLGVFVLRKRKPVAQG